MTVLRPGTMALTVLLATLTGIGPMTTDIYLPSLPVLAQALNSTTAQAQLTISTYLVGFAVGQMFYGPLADRHGRKPVLLVALGIYIVAALAAALAPNIETLIVARAVQGIGGSGGIVLTRAVVRDLYSGARAGRELSIIGAVMALAPVIAPGVGGILEASFGWRSIFYVLTAGGLLLMLFTWRRMPETLAARAPEPVSPASILRSFRSIGAQPVYLAYVALAVLSFAGLFAWISGASFVLQDIYGLTPLAFGFAFACGSLGYMFGTIVAARFVGRLGLDRVLGIGCCGLAGGGLLMVAALGFGFASSATLVIAVAVYLAGMGLVLPQSIAGALTPFPDRAGAASSLLGVLQQAAAAISGSIVGVLLGRTAWPLAIVIALMGCAALLSWVLTRGIRHARPAEL